MEAVKRTKEYTVFKKRSGRYAVKGADKKWINGDAKVDILAANKFITVAAPKPAPAPEEPAAEEAEAPAEETTEASDS